MFQIKYNNRKSFWLYSCLLLLVFVAFIYAVIYQLLSLNDGLSQRMAKQKSENVKELFYHELHSFFQTGEKTIQIINDQSQASSVDDQLQQLSLLYQSDDALLKLNLQVYDGQGHFLTQNDYKNVLGNSAIFPLGIHPKQGLQVNAARNKIFWQEKYQNENKIYVLGFVFDLKAFQDHVSPMLQHQESKISLYLPSGKCFYQSYGHDLKALSQQNIKDLSLQKNITLPSQKPNALGLVSALDDYGLYLKIESTKLLFDTEIASLHRYTWLLGITSLLCLLGLFWFSERKIAREEARNHRLREEKQKLELVNEMQQKENALLQLQQLKNQINPHFLFNSLNSLHALILQNPQLSQEFVLKLANVYRYILNQKEIDHASVLQELDFVQEYYFLQKIRFGEALDLQIEIENKNHLQHKIPFLSLQSLIENAIKHNVISLQKKLLINIWVRADKIVVSNLLQKRRTKPQDSHKIGLSYLRNIYQFNQIEGFEAGEKEACYVAVLPFLDH